MSNASITYNDYGSEPGVVGFQGEFLLDDGTNYAAQKALFDTLVGATDAITVGNRIRESFGEQAIISDAAAGSTDAQRERKWLVQYSELVTFRKHTLEIPTADSSYIDPGSEQAFPSAAVDPDIQAWIDAFEAFQTKGGQAVEVRRITLVGRNT
jgi:hypothetical protein